MSFGVLSQSKSHGNTIMELSKDSHLFNNETNKRCNILVHHSDLTLVTICGMTVMSHQWFEPLMYYLFATPTVHIRLFSSITINFCARKLAFIYGQ